MSEAKKIDDTSPLVEKIAAVFNEQATNIEKTSAMVKEIEVDVKKSLKKSEDTQTISLDVRALSEKANRSITDLKRTILKLFNVSSKVKNIEEQIIKVQDKTKIIDEIVDEIEALAINASIESGRAGMHGYAFEVIAERVRELSDTTSNASTSIFDIVNDTRSFVEATLGEILTEVESSRESLNGAVQAFGEISKNVVVISDACSDNYNSVVSQLENFNKVNFTLNNEIENISRSVSTVVTELTGVQIVDIEAREAVKILENAAIIDVRRVAEFNDDIGHIENSQLMTIDEEFESKLKSLDKDKNYLFVCRSGGRSARAASIALRLGFKNIYNLKQGLLDWKDNGYPCVHDKE